jgi:hypothetical protein
MQRKNPLLLEPETLEDQELPNGIELDEHGRPIGALPIQMFYDALDKKLIAHFGEEFRLLLNVSRMEQGMQAL